MTFVLVTVIFGAAADDDAAKKSKGSAPLAIGLAISTCILFAVSWDQMMALGVHRNKRKEVSK